MLIEILGPGCPKCEKLAAAAQEAVAELALDAEVVEVKSITEITARGVLMTPAIVVDGEVKSSGRVLTAPQIRELIAPDA
ncbi:MAG: thioredoxin family protein [Planctomycetota bacterium]|jgi:small redox-active disulfide protein 2